MKLYITGGGTGGHVTPGLAIAKYFKEKHPDTEIRFAGSERGIENKLVPREGYPLDSIEIIGLSRSLSPKGVAHNIKAANLAAKAVKKAKKMLKEAKPDCVIGCGGYASFAVVYAAQKLGIPTVLLEVNALPGKVTKMLCKNADKVLVCFDQAKEILGNDEKIVVTGSPVRGEIMTADREKARKKFGLSEEDNLVVSFWGSMGAKYMNEHMADLLALECKKNVPYYHVHASGAAAKEWLPMRVKQQGGALKDHPNITLTEYIYDMDDRLAAADLVLCRAGAATLGEICMLGRPSIVVPSPYVAENHQEKNARAIEKIGGCRVVLEKEATAEKLLGEIESMLSDKAQLKEMGRKANKLAAPLASEIIYQEIMQAIKGIDEKRT